MVPTALIYINMYPLHQPHPSATSLSFAAISFLPGVTSLIPMENPLLAREHTGAHFTGHKATGVN